MAMTTPNKNTFICQYYIVIFKCKLINIKKLIL